MRLLVFLLTFGLSLVAFAQADGCAAYEVSTKALPPLHWNQPGRGWCYSVVTADLLSAEMQIPISSVAIANFTERFTNDTYQTKLRSLYYQDASQYHRFSNFGKTYADAALAIQQKGVCPVSVLENSKDLPQNRDQFLDSLFGDLERSRTQDPQAFHRGLQNAFAGVDAQFAEKLFTAAQGNYRPLIDHAVEMSCARPIAMPHLKMHRENLLDLSHEQALAKVQSLLSQGKLIGVGYDSKLIKNPAMADRERANHASILMGQFFDSKDKVCKFKIRTTDLATCQAADASLNCREGIFTVDRALALQAMSDLIWLAIPK